MKNINKQAPPSGWIKFKLNFDAAITYGKTSLTIVARDEKGTLLMVMAEQTVLLSPLLGEAKAALFAIGRAVDEGFKKIIVDFSKNKKINHCGRGCLECY